MLATRLIRLGVLTMLLMLAIMYTQLMADGKFDFPYDMSISMSITHTSTSVFYILGTLSACLMISGIALELRRENMYSQTFLTVLITLCLSAFMWLKYFAHNPGKNDSKKEKLHIKIASLVVLGMGAVILVLAIQRRSFVNIGLTLFYFAAVCFMIYCHVNLMKEYNKDKEINTETYDWYSRGFAGGEIAASIVFVITLIYTL